MFSLRPLRIPLRTLRLKERKLNRKGREVFAKNAKKKKTNFMPFTVQQYKNERQCEGAENDQKK